MALQAPAVGESSARKVAIVTGCASGIGLATTNLFLSHQYQVLGVDVNEIDLANIASNARELFQFHRANLMEDEQCDEVVKACVAKFGQKIDVLANVAGVMDAFASTETYTDAQWDRVIAINLTAPTRLIRAVLPSMKENKGGSIINVCSKAAISGATAGVAYTASKHGLLGVTRNTAWRFRNDGIRCNAVLPGGTATNISNSIDQPSFDAIAFAELAPVMTLHTPLQGIPAITGHDVACAILFLASDGAKFINGAALPIDKAWGVI